MSIHDTLYHLYRGLPRARGKYLVSTDKTSEGKVKGTAVTVRQEYIPENWINHINGREGLGVIPITDDGTCCWGAIDIDKYPLDIIGLEHKIRELKLPIVVLRSKSGGAHLTVFFENPLPCKEVTSKLVEVASALGYGGCEIYPKQIKLANLQDVGNWLNMPYFNAERTDRYALYNGVPLNLAEFIAHAQDMQIRDLNQLHIDLVVDALSDGPPCLQALCKNKVSEGGRNTTLFNLGVYCRLKHESDWEQEVMAMNREYLDPSLTYAEAATVIKSLDKKAYAYTCNSPPISNYCNRELCKRREFGISSFQHVDIGVVLDSISKLTTEPPMWIISLDGVRTEVETEELLDQVRFRRVCMNTINKIPGRMKGEEWDKFIRSKLSTIEIIDAPIEAKFSTRILEYLHSFLDMYPQGRTLDELSMGRWFVTGTHYVFRGTDFLIFLERQGARVDPRKVWNVVSSFGVAFQTMQIRGVQTQVWQAPISMYLPKDSISKPETKIEDF